MVLWHHQSDLHITQPGGNHRRKASEVHVQMALHIFLRTLVTSFVQTRASTLSSHNDAFAPSARAVHLWAFLSPHPACQNLLVNKYSGHLAVAVVWGTECNPL